MSLLNSVRVKFTFMLVRGVVLKNQLLSDVTSITTGFYCGLDGSRIGCTNTTTTTPVWTTQRPT